VHRLPNYIEKLLLRKTARGIRPFLATIMNESLGRPFMDSFGRYLSQTTHDHGRGRVRRERLICLGLTGYSTRKSWLQG
jgi:hypothetical protein